MSNELSYSPVEQYSNETTRGGLRGNLADINVTQLLNLINIAKKTGALRFFEPKANREFFGLGGGANKPKVVPGNECGTIWFRAGNMTRASVGSGNGHLVDILHKARKLDSEQAELIREWSNGKTEKALAITLINANYVTHADVVASLTHHTLDYVYEIMSWSEQFFEFEENAVLPDDRLTISLDTRQVVKDGTMRTNEIRRLEQALPNLDFALKFTASPEEKLRGAQLSIHEWRVVSYVNPEISVGQIAALCHMTEAEIRKVVIRLLRADLVELVEMPRWGLRPRMRRTTQSMPKVNPNDQWPPGNKSDKVHQ